MNDDATHDSPARPSGARRQESGTSGLRATRRRRWRRMETKAINNAGLLKKFDFLTHLLKNLDMLVYAELSALYYMECSTVRFFVRAWSQQNFLSPKPDDWPIPMPAIQAQILSVFFPALVCLLAHIFETLSSAGEASRGYLHGGVIVDFVGQKPPTTRLTLIALDLVILALQCFMLSVNEEREKLRVILRPKRRTGASPAPTETESNVGSSTSELGAQGVGRTAADAPRPTPGDSEEVDIEMQNLGGQDSQTGDDERRPFLSATPTTTPRPGRTTYLDVMYSGNGMLKDFNVMHTIQSATPDFWGAVGHSLRTMGYQAAMARIRSRIQMPTFRRR